MMVLTCSTAKEFYDCLEELVKRGLGFKADYHYLTITLTGGF